MRCVIHGDSSCPPFCTGVVQTPPEASDAPPPPSDARLDVSDIANDQRVRELFTAGLDIGQALDKLRALRRDTQNMREALTWVDSRLDDAEALLAKYAADKKPDAQ